VDLLLGSPWKVELSRANGWIAHPTRFMAQKLLIHDRRERRSRAKDILYLHDTIELFGASLDVLREDWERAAKPELSESAIRTIEASSDTVFFEGNRRHKRCGSSGCRARPDTGKNSGIVSSRPESCVWNCDPS
jgi:hypothetical protein